MIREDLGKVHILSCIDEEAPPEDVEEDEEHGCVKACCVCGSEEFSRQRT